MRILREKNKRAGDKSTTKMTLNNFRQKPGENVILEKEDEQTTYTKTER